ncbi:polysaccharide biosynthesis/export family protein [Bradyrhizobium sp. NAS96.2]|uniref:polysaccharide biosynthesis/export family protein n=1 Tax=Bradyrhizobium sp. NAS96.2 TaxID=1680160 RepID=UPI00093A4ABF|nr:polysaccharide biosynthesis/export family protein [Bradyrhizobium sp. NAS96.2]OKO80348.1 sugar transporter [Bradyrhizobium sp. NAS96.2]
MPVARALRLPITAVVAALALSGCMSTSGPVAVGPQGVDAVTYGPAYAPAPVADGGGGAISALRSAFASASPGYGYAAPVVYAAAPGRPAGYDNSYHLGPGDKLRVVVYGQEGLTNSYAIDAAGAITMPLIGSVPARGRTPAGLAGEISARLRNGFIREPSVAVEIESYRPFFILGEVQAPGQYPYVPNMTVESAVAIAGGFSPRAKRDSVTLTHTDASGAGRFVVPLGTPMSPGDTVFVGERWF